MFQLEEKLNQPVVYTRGLERVAGVQHARQCENERGVVIN